MHPTAHSDWPLYGLGKLTSTSSSTKQDDPEVAGVDVADDGAANVDVDTNAQRPDKAVTTMATAAGVAPPQPLVTSDPVILTGLLTNSNISPLLVPLPADPLLPLPTGESMEIVLINQDQDFPDLEVPSGLELPLPSCWNDILLTGIEDLPMDATESGWMKSKKTLKYFREIHKTGKLSELILHWYQLEEALGFLESEFSHSLSQENAS